MVRSLYLKIVGTFIGVVLVSICLSYLLTPYSLDKEKIFKEELSKISIVLAEVIQMSGPENISNLIEEFDDLDFEVLITDGDHIIYKMEGDSSIPIHQADIDEILEHSFDDPVVRVDQNNPSARIIGIPIDVSGENYALITRIDYEDEFEDLQQGIFVSLVIVLLIGSLLIFLASTYLVKPIRKMTHAARKIAKGDFSVRIEKKNRRNQDEVGELIDSFNHMTAELEKIDAMRADFVSNVSHEIQSPLTSIKGFTKAIMDDVVPRENQKEYLQIIYQEIERMSRLSDNLLRIASLDSEHHPYNPSSYRLDEQIRNSILTTEPQWNSKNIDIQLDLEPVEIYADKDLMDQVWLNLITNAIKYSNENEIIQIGISIQSGQIKVAVRDYGIGIPKDELASVFGRFYKVDRSRNRSIDGNGLGLSIVKKILTIHKFSIDVESEEDVGSTFTVNIPINQ
ncbi:sensor histidine kinase [Ornithinibacillus halotolerans]|uniref:Heme sensor protein HssS n=1 Tax=Ornithinibacillus halotolerans TaxID=1274357 RepID=A0A916WCZ8_9BACI|nr:HAMP domain-containing sensor histidine kinase [Ornithinibacillus halotolerans]GGA89660.1 two-component sensor histidine kinase [Ornithinibacillus halotolerans]